MHIEITRDTGNLKKGQVFENMSAVEGARLMTMAAAKEVGTCQLTAAEVKRMSASQLRAVAKGRKITVGELVKTVTEPEKKKQTGLQDKSIK